MGSLIDKLKRLICALFGHRYVVERHFSPRSRKVGCPRCECTWGMHDPTRSLIPWDGELEQLYRDLGQWPGIPGARSDGETARRRIVDADIRSAMQRVSKT